MSASAAPHHDGDITLLLSSVLSVLLVAASTRRSQCSLEMAYLLLNGHSL